MLLFRPSVPSESTIKRVVATDGARMMQVWDAHVPELVDAAFGPVMSQVDLVSTSADGAMVPLRGIAAAASAERDGPDDTPEVASRSYRTRSSHCEANRLSGVWNVAWQIHVQNERASYANQTAA